MLARAAALLGLASLAGCLDAPGLVNLAAPATVAGIPSGAPWMALPLGAWIAESEVQPQAIAACSPAECPTRVAVGVFRAVGSEAKALEAVLARPDILRRALDAQDARDPPARRVRTVVSVERWTASPHRGFAIRLARADGTRAAHGAVVAARGADPLRFVIAIGPDAAAVEQAARDAAGANLR